MDHVITVLPARHTSAVMAVDAVVCIAIIALLVAYARSRSKWTLASCAPLVAFAIVVGCYGYANDSEITSKQYPSQRSIARSLGLRTEDKGVTYYDLDGHVYTDCQTTTNSIDATHLTSKISCVIGNRRVTITTKKG